jgi:hypothetical protein
MHFLIFTLDQVICVMFDLKPRCLSTVKGAPGNHGLQGDPAGGLVGSGRGRDKRAVVPVVMARRQHGELAAVKIGGGGRCSAEPGRNREGGRGGEVPHLVRD